MPTPSTDRREHRRFDILGSLWADLNLPESARVLNVSDTGLLIEAHVCPALDSVHTADVKTEGESKRVTAVVRHVQPIGWEHSFLVGLEMVASPAHAASTANHRESHVQGKPVPTDSGLRPDRRRSPRRTCDAGVVADLAWPQPVRMVDISANGALMASTQPGTIGARCLLTFAVGSHRFAVDVELRRQTPYYDGSGYNLGAKFLRLAEHQRDIVESLSGSQ